MVRRPSFSLVVMGVSLSLLGGVALTTGTFMFNRAHPEASELHAVVDTLAIERREIVAARCDLNEVYQRFNASHIAPFQSATVENTYHTYLDRLDGAVGQYNRLVDKYQARIAALRRWYPWWMIVSWQTVYGLPRNLQPETRSPWPDRLEQNIPLPLTLFQPLHPQSGCCIYFFGRLSTIRFSFNSVSMPSMSVN